ncbi:hypothetical protein FVEG_07404 [Fusarium verticillioides 7600]|uniref:Uncharacterized protein n=1 Tax=Gibberella moniliformis (strain M3125 / FGSC 7600) TaxID=334819 RepID=W7MI45_GIBM7|nr:hypothetical protein FVEG_07404 [Fusarium verticillioides 7600]EWG47240.1 hypothetical protein FVEG_07404 [Fusarium verticillioides 7600]
MMHIFVGDDDATTLLQEKRGRWWASKQPGNQQPPRGILKIGTTSCLFFVARTYYWYNLMQIAYKYPPPAQPSPGTVRHCLCSMSHSNSSAVPFRGATLECATRLITS